MALTPKQEAFARAYVETGNASEAYRQAYNAKNMQPNAIKVEASRLLDDPNVTLTVSALRDAANERCVVTVLSLTQELEEARALALQEAMPSAAVAASMGKAKLHGLLVDKAEHTGKDGGAIQLEQVRNDADAFARTVASLAARAGTRSAP